MVKISNLKQGEVVQSIYLWHIDSFYQEPYGSKEVYIIVRRSLKHPDGILYKYETINMKELRFENGILTRY